MDPRVSDWQLSSPDHGNAPKCGHMSRARKFHENMLLLVLFAESRGASTALGKETKSMYCCQ